MQSLGTFKDNQDGTLKSVYEGEDKKIIEMSLLFNKEDKDVICVPTHHFCNLGCKMCHLTNNHLNKQMVPIKSDDFLECLYKTLTYNGKRITDKKKLLISFMGVGEPLLNLNLIKEVYENEELIKKALNYEEVGYALATMMPNDNLVELTTKVYELNMPLKVHFSLHTPIDEKRYDLIPSTNVTVEQALAYLVNYRDKVKANNTIMSKYLELHQTADPIEIHYTLINGVNDSQNELDLLIDLLKKYQIPIKFIRFNPINELKVSENENMWIEKIKNTLPDLKIELYCPPGKEVGSSCGEFTKHYYHEEIESLAEQQEFENWYNKHLVRVKK